MVVDILGSGVMGRGMAMARWSIRIRTNILGGGLMIRSVNTKRSFLKMALNIQASVIRIIK